MFADISGFTSMSEKMDPEEVMMLMNETFQLMGRIIENLSIIQSRGSHGCHRLYRDVLQQLSTSFNFGIPEPNDFEKEIMNFAA